MKRIWVAVFLLWPLVAHADTDPSCSNAHFMKAADPQLTTGRCDIVKSTVIEPAPRPEDNKILQVLRVGAADPHESAVLGDLDDFVRKMKASTSAVRMQWPDKISVVLDGNEIAPERRGDQLTQLEAAKADHAAKRDECVLAYHYKSADPRKLFVLAHQYFHCVVLHTWEEARFGPSDADWWAEGSAEFFASIMYPDIGTAADAVTFRANESLSLLRRGADAVVFFDWYCTKPGKLKGLLDIVQEHAAGQVMVDLVEEISGNKWLEFEEAYYDHSIRVPGGGLVYTETPLPQTQSISGSTTKNFTAEPFEIHGAVLEFAQGHAYDLDGGEENDFHWKWSEGTGGGWEEPPHTVHTCHENKKYRLVLAAKDRHVTKRLRITARDERESECPCVVGAWTQTAASLARVAGRLQSHGVHNAQCTIDGGGTTLVFTGDHNGGETYNGMHTTCTSPTSTSEGTTNGTRAFTWTDTSATQMTFSSAGGNASSHITVTVRGHSSQMDAPLTGQGVGAVTYRCSRTDLHLEFGSEAFDYTRPASSH
ncbi:MAG: hypothetical protein QM831_03385 [Kofleriaceae bacterium]